MKHKKHKIDISDWGIQAFNKVSNILEKSFCKAISEVLTYAFEIDETYIDFPVQWERMDGSGVPSVKDPLTVYLHLALDNGDGKLPTYEFNLRDSLSGAIADCAIDGSFSTGLGRLSTALRQLADEIDAARKNSETDDG